MARTNVGVAALQWSHVFSDMVSDIIYEHIYSIITASMEPCLFRHGKGPDVPALTGALVYASMEPCLFRHGKQTGARWSRPARTGFNGAMSFQTW